MVRYRANVGTPAPVGPTATKVALKVLKPELAAVLGGDRFLVEIMTTASLRSTRTSCRSSIPVSLD